MGTCSHPPVLWILGFGHSLQSLFYFLLKPQLFAALQTARFQHSAELLVSIFQVEGELRSHKEISQLFTLQFLCRAHFPGIIPLSWAKSCPALRTAELGLVLAAFALNLQEMKFRAKLMRVRPFLSP